MNTSASASEQPKKLTKVERLKMDLEVAKATLAREEPGLMAALAKAEAELKAMRKTYEGAEKAASAAYEAIRVARQEETVRLGLGTKTGDYSERLLASLKTFVVEAGLPDADLATLAREVVSRDVGNVPRVVELTKALEVATKTKDRAYRAWNVASCPTGDVYRLNGKLEALRDGVRRLEDEIKRVPSRNQQARERREDVRREAAEMMHTERARSLLPTFSFKTEEQ